MLGEIAVRYPRAVFLMGHSGYGDWEASVRIAAELSNVYLELTAVYAAHDFAMQPNGSGTPAALISCLQVNGILEYMVEQAGSHKIVFGTDMPWYSPHFAAGGALCQDTATMPVTTFCTAMRNACSGSRPKDAMPQIVDRR